ncbi:hypothetical protein FH972_015353 [Carpinus fangiana]|uniref:Uncharacterized protein n=1 Tax=Carpinus fangiana TaxID=176857 RepID=A0A5N6RG27_9ROSI|nr:hypothetical protein FH972_015353 [Carpinus fangiana]
MAHMAWERGEITAQVIAQVTAQVAQQMAVQMEAYEARIRALVKGSRVVTFELEVTNVITPARVIYRFSVDSQSKPNDNHNEDQPWISVGQKSRLSK